MDQRQLLFIKLGDQLQVIDLLHFRRHDRDHFKNSTPLKTFSLTVVSKSELELVSKTVDELVSQLIDRKVL